MDILDKLKELNNFGKTIIIITHDDVVAKNCHIIIYIEDGVIK